MMSEKLVPVEICQESILVKFEDDLFLDPKTENVEQIKRVKFTSQNVDELHEFYKRRVEGLEVQLREKHKETKKLKAQLDAVEDKNAALRMEIGCHRKFVADTKLQLDEKISELTAAHEEIRRLKSKFGEEKAREVIHLKDHSQREFEVSKEHKGSVLENIFRHPSRHKSIVSRVPVVPRQRHVVCPSSSTEMPVLRELSVIVTRMKIPKNWTGSVSNMDVRPIDHSISHGAEKVHVSNSQHKQSVTDDKSLSCELCYRQFSNARRLNCHKWHCKRQKDLNTTAASIVSEPPSNLNRSSLSVNSVAGEPLPATCLVCGQSFRNRRGVAAHSRVHYKSQTLNNTIDNRSSQSTNKVVLQNDNNKNNSKVQFSRMEIDDDIRSVVSEIVPGNKHFCVICKSKFSDTKKYQSHMQRHRHNEHTFLCEVCCTIFQNEEEFRNHIQGHVDGKTHACEICGKIFADQRLLKAHSDTQQCHTITCNVCNKMFQNKSQLVEHKKQHEVRCYICDKIFRNGTLLSLHRKKIHLLKN